MPDPLSELVDLALRIARPDRTVELLPGLGLYASHGDESAAASLYAPMACIILQGEMEVTIGAAVLNYAPATCFVGSIHLPVTSRITRASRERPYLALTLDLDRESLADLIAQAPAVQPERGKCYAMGPASVEILDACHRLLALHPDEMPVLGQLIRREILFRLLHGPQAAALHQIVALDHRLQQVRRSLLWMRDNPAQSAPVADMARCAGMSEPSFRRHFRAATGFSPLQYHKMLRLQQARRAILSGREISGAAFDVGYQSASQFSREYARMFGLAPSRDARRMLVDA